MNKKKIAPIVITLILLIYYFAYFGIIIATVPLMARILLGIIPLALGGASIYVLVERIKEINGGEEDDLSQY